MYEHTTFTNVISHIIKSPISQLYGGNTLINHYSNVIQYGNCF